MLFNSIDFLIFFPIVVLLYYVIPKRYRYLWLLAASYYFYMSWNAKYALLLFFSTVITYICGYLIDWFGRSIEDTRKASNAKKAALICCLVLNLAILFVFKYHDFFAGSIGDVLAAVGIQVSVPQFSLLLPVGISFYTFQALSYTIDVYKGEIYAEKNFFRYALFVSFFPQLVAGPIERSKNLLKQLGTAVPYNTRHIKEGLLLMMWGYFLKIMIADRVAIIVDQIYNHVGAYSGCYFIVATVLFAVQIYCDFAGYSIIAGGAAKILGIELMENFNAPYLAKSVSEFWRRWHISLSTWFRDYVYIPLGGNRKGRARKYINLLIVFCLSGLWHGASWTFMVWGGLNGLYQVVGDALQSVRNKCVSLLHLDRETLAHKGIRVVMTFLFIDFAWIFFRADTIGTAWYIIKSIFRAENYGIVLDGSLYNLGLESFNVWILLIAILILFLADVAKYRGVTLRKVIMKQDGWFQWAIIAAGFWGLLLFGVYGVEYDAGQFIYFQF